MRKGFSKGEKDLYKGAELILEREKQQIKAEEEKTKAVSTYRSWLFVLVLWEENAFCWYPSANQKIREQT